MVNYTEYQCKRKTCITAIRIVEEKLNVFIFTKMLGGKNCFAILTYFLLRLICKDVPWASVTVLGFGAGKPME